LVFKRSSAAGLEQDIQGVKAVFAAKRKMVQYALVIIGRTRSAGLHLTKQT
jgi:hypothetical protein